MRLAWRGSAWIIELGLGLATTLFRVISMDQLVRAFTHVLLAIRCLTPRYRVRLGNLPLHVFNHMEMLYMQFG